MWRAEPRREAVCLRVGRHAVEAWQGRTGALVPLAHCDLQRATPWDATALEAALQAALAGVDGVAEVSVVLESAWMPVVAVEVGAAWRAREIEALLRHRFDTLYREPEAQVGAWRLRTDFRIGQVLAVGYGLHPALAEGLEATARARGRAWAGLWPALSWGLAASRGHRWLAWPEQDRTLLARVQSGAVVALNACAAPAAAPDALARLVDLECLRGGIARGTVPLEAASWAADPGADVPALGLRWLRLASSSATLDAA